MIFFFNIKMSLFGSTFDINDCNFNFDFIKQNDEKNKITKFLKKKYLKKIIENLRDNKIYEETHKDLFKIKEYANIIYAEFDPFAETSYFLDVSNKIDDLCVEIEIVRKPFKKSKRVHYKLIITPFYFENLKPFKQQNPIFEYTEVNSDINRDMKYFYNFMKTIIFKMKELKFDKLYNKLTTTLESKKINLECNIFKDFYDKEDCCICMEETTCKTICNHSICLKCYGSLIEKSTKLNATVNCPICRKVLRTPYNIDDFDVDEEDEEYFEENDDIQLVIS